MENHGANLWFFLLNIVISYKKSIAEKSEILEFIYNKKIKADMVNQKEILIVFCYGLLTIIIFWFYLKFKKKD